MSAANLRPVPDDDGVVWEEPPPRHRGGRAEGEWSRRIAPLMDHVGRWAMIAEVGTLQQAQNVASSLRRGGIARPSGAWEFAAREGKLYARYLGPDA